LNKAAQHLKYYFIKKITMKQKFFLACSFLILGLASGAQKTYDVCIYGGTSAGVIAAYTVKMKGKSVLLIEPGKPFGRTFFRRIRLH
jgi:NADPH-dependent 2,4-dienoyl-CoA reductase/sulfur reductase-like enzyme